MQRYEARITALERLVGRQVLEIEKQPVNERSFDRLSSEPRSRSGPAEKRRPLLHERPPPLEQVRPPIRRVDGVRVHMRRRQLADLARGVRALRRPAGRLRPCGPHAGRRPAFQANAPSRVLGSKG